jgi:hypothetical protein
MSRKEAGPLLSGPARLAQSRNDRRYPDEDIGYIDPNFDVLPPNDHNLVLRYSRRRFPVRVSVSWRDNGFSAVARFYRPHPSRVLWI